LAPHKFVGLNGLPLDPIILLADDDPDDAEGEGVAVTVDGEVNGGGGVGVRLP